MRYTDPTGHAEWEDPYESNERTCDPDDESCNWVGGGKDDDDGNNNSGNGGGGGQPLLAPTNTITQNCQSNPYCFCASESEINSMMGVLSFMQGVEIVGVTFFATVGGLLLPTPYTSAGWVSLAVAAELGIEAGLEAPDTKSYLDDALTAAHNNGGAVEMHKDGNFITTTYTYEGAPRPDSVTAPITRFLMSVWSWTASWDDAP